MKTIKSYSDAAVYLDSFINLERRNDPVVKRAYRLDRMEFLLSRFDNPQNDFLSVHIAGSKGKGSTAVLFASVLRESGVRVGLYTSPHVTGLRERISLNGKPISASLFVSLLSRIQKVIDPMTEEDFPGQLMPTFFEIVTLLAFLAFREKRCRYAVIETGLGGRLDATNTVFPIVSLLTPIELEHEELLGNSLEEIAREKCGIIKPGIPVFSSAQASAVREIIRQTAESKGSPLSFVDREIERLDTEPLLEKTAVTVAAKYSTPLHFTLTLHGDFQAENAVLVLLAIKKLLPFITDHMIKKGFARAFLPGRLEFVRKRPLVLLDGAHTPGSMTRVASFIKNTLPEPRVLIFGAVSGKKHEEMSTILSPLFRWIIVTTPGTFKKSDPQSVLAAFQKLRPDTLFEHNPVDALKRALGLSCSRHPVVVTGSFYLVAEIRKLFR